MIISGIHKDTAGRVVGAGDGVAVGVAATSAGSVERAGLGLGAGFGAATGAGVIRDRAFDDLEPEWQSALDELDVLGLLGSPDEAAFDAIEQVLRSVVD